jgi:hypothetical protein
MIAMLELTVIDKQEKPLQDAHISLTSFDTRLSAVTDENGFAKFGNLAPQTYYITTLFKEYSFEDNSNQITIKEGEHAKKLMVAKRIAFSAYGQILTIAGKAFPTGSVVASLVDSDYYK